MVGSGEGGGPGGGCLGVVGFGEEFLGAIR